MAVVSAPADVQRARVLARPTMDEVKLAAILARQAGPPASCGRASQVLNHLQRVAFPRPSVLVRVGAQSCTAVPRAGHDAVSCTVIRGLLATAMAQCLHATIGA